MFIDRGKIHVKGGDGGHGAVSFRREKHIPKGGPDGGDGGAGGDVILVVKKDLSTLSSLKYRRHFHASKGVTGEGGNRRGARGGALEVPVPPGTLVLDEDGRVIADLVEDGQREVVARGGRGGRGNARFKSSRHRTPRFRELGEPGQERWIVLELKLLADVGLVGFPNAGKSTLLSVISAARPEIADYPFTTLEPHLGVVSLDYDRSFVAADVPGLIEGAHSGVGLGTEFLRHVERTAVLLHMVDLADPSEKDPVQAFEEIEHELKSYDPTLLEKPRLVVANKMDVPVAEERWSAFSDCMQKRGFRVFCISAVTRKGIDELLEATWHALQEARTPSPSFETPGEPTGYRVYRAPEQEASNIEQVEPGHWRVQNNRLERWVAMTDMDNQDALLYLNRRLRRAGLYDHLRDAGVTEGDTVEIGDMEFEYEES